jgi:hypothetical protein
MDKLKNMVLKVSNIKRFCLVWHKLKEEEQKKDHGHNNNGNFKFS